MTAIIYYPCVRNSKVKNSIRFKLLNIIKSPGDKKQISEKVEV